MGKSRRLAVAWGPVFALAAGAVECRAQSAPEDSPVSAIEAVVGDSIRIERLDSDGPGYSRVRMGPDEWHAILERPGGQPVRYVMRRFD